MKFIMTCRVYGSTDAIAVIYHNSVTSIDATENSPLLTGVGTVCCSVFLKFR